jgi:hypothetical protein
VSKEKTADDKDWSAAAKAGSRIAAVGKSAGNMQQSVRLVMAIFSSTKAAFQSMNRATDNVVKIGLYRSALHVFTIGGQRVSNQE